MKNLNKFSFGVPLVILLMVVIGCNFSFGTAFMSSLKTSKDKEGKQPAETFTPGEVIYARTDISNNPGKVKVRFLMTADKDMFGIKKGEPLKGAEVTLDIEGDKTAYYEIPGTGGLPGGKYTIIVEMSDDKGEKIASQSVEITMEENEDPKSGYSPPVGNGGG
jgi:hypothetical protein